MTPQQKTYALFGGVFVILLVATLIGRVMATRANGDAGRETIQNLNDRIDAWWVMIAIFAASFALGRAATLVLFALSSFYTLREFVSLTPTRPADNLPLIGAFYVLLPLQYVLIGMGWYGLFSILVPVYGFLLIPILAALAGDVEDFLLRVARVQWALMLTVYSISHAPALTTLEIPGYEGQSFLLLFFLITVVQFSDVAQYVCGKLFGKRKIAPKISPSKTMEGLLGGGAAATLLGAALFWITPFNPWQAAAMAAAIVAMGFLGGLSLSAVKRSMGVKDWGHSVKGHGGVLDRMDSVCFSAPVFFHLTRYFFAA
jgi:phosphatidate cytidylyltransferase